LLLVRPSQPGLRFRPEHWHGADGRDRRSGHGLGTRTWRGDLFPRSTTAALTAEPGGVQPAHLRRAADCDRVVRARRPARRRSTRGPPMSAPLLKIEAVTRQFGGLVAVRDVSLEIKASEIVGVIGPNGAGKT